MTAQEAHHLVTAQLDRLTQDAALWRSWALTLSRFHRYSFANTLLIWAQRPDATHVAGYRRWQQLGRYVQKGEHGIRILAPLVKKSAADADPDALAASDDDARSVLVGFRTVTVFDITQTAGAPLALPTPTLLTDDTGTELFDTLVSRAVPVPVLYDSRKALQNANGLWNPNARTITLADDLAPTQRLKTLLHEWAHSVGVPDRMAALLRDTAAEEVIAETTAFVVAARLGFDTTAYSLPYVGHWAQGQPERLRAVTQEIVRRVRVLLTAIEAVWPLAEPDRLAPAG